MGSRSSVGGWRPFSPWPAVWLFGVAALVIMLIVVGGATRLTGSGLSIVVWDVIGGILPPRSPEQWAAAFAQYQASPEYTQVNAWMTVEDFKSIYWWEWGHRLLGRLVGVAFAVPFLVLWVRRMLPIEWLLRFAFLLGLGAMQGVIGWWMVRSGLVDRAEVSAYRLAVHLGLAFVILGLLLDYAVRWSGRSVEFRVPGGAVSALAQIIPLLILLQVIAGGFVAGTDAGRIATNWPLMGESLWPSGGLELRPLWRNLFENRMLVQFDHRILAYLILVLEVGFVILAWRSSPSVRRWAVTLLVVSTVQAGLGIVTLLTAVEVSWALVHQFGAIIVFAVAIVTRRTVMDSKAEPIGLSLRSWPGR